jgi:predicted CXXCH cytochrome family protein
VECLSCHDGAISKLGVVDMRAGMFQHGEIGPSHPVGVAYPRGAAAAEYTPAERLPASVQLFDGRVGCLSCHSPYSQRAAMLVMEMRGSALCVACHRK